MFEKLDSQSFQIHLKGAGMSGRGVRFVMLAPQVKRKSDALAASLLGKDATNLEYFQSRILEGTKSFITHVTEKHSLDTLFGDDLKWQRVTYSDLNTPDSPLCLDGGDVFTPADVETLQGLYRLFHEPSQEQVQTIMGEAKPIA
jgi:hypothetical protein